MEQTNPLLFNKCAYCNKEFIVRKTTISHCSNICKEGIFKNERVLLTKFWEKSNMTLIKKGFVTEANKGYELEKFVWLLYVETGSLRKTLAGIPEEYADLFDLKRIHSIVKVWRNELQKEYFNTGFLSLIPRGNTIESWSMDNIGTIPKSKETYSI
jgi:hypothetical protein